MRENEDREAPKSPENGVFSTYTWETLYQSLKRLSANGASLRQIAKNEFGGRVTHAVIQRCLLGKEPRKPHIRAALGLPEIIEIRVHRKQGRFCKPPGGEDG